jgi:hypothetical protein
MSRFGIVPISLIRKRGDTPADWVPDYRSVTFHFPGGNLNETHTLGQGPLKLTATVRLADSDAFTRFLALVNTRQTLRMDYHATAFGGDRDGQEFGALYKDFDGVFLNAPTNILRRLGGQIDLDVVFEREPSS